MRIGIIVAMSVEYRQLANRLTRRTEQAHAPFHFTEGQAGGNQIILMQCGIGKTNAAVGTTELIRHYHPDCIISTGVAGGVGSQVRVMDVVVGAQLAYHDVWCGEGNEYGQVQGLPARFATDGPLYQKALSLEVPTRLHGGLICTGDQFITAGQELDTILRRFPDALAVDMESAAIAQVCHLYQVPFLSFRIISDTPGVEGHFDQYLNFWDVMADKSFGVTQALLAALTA